jgi:2-(1,2-epoxy-1,2-dihydrophenyl)acetyl-CoA isomerase
VTVDYELDQSVARIYLNRPHRLNAVVPELTAGLVTALGRAGRDGARVVILAGRGRAFCSGFDLKEPMPAETVLATRIRVDGIQEVTRAIRRFPGPVVAATTRSQPAASSRSAAIWWSRRRTRSSGSLRYRLV